MASGRWTAAFLAAAGAAAILATAAAGQEKPAAKAKVEDLAWMAGSWRSEHDGDVFEEHWLPPAGGCMAAVFRAVEGGKPDMFEISSIETAADGTVALRIRHFGAELVPWKSEGEKAPSWTLQSATKDMAVFEDPKQEFPRRIAYRLLGGDTLGVRLDGTEESKRKPLVFQLKRVK
jgi:hypothetical protein